MFGLLDIGMCSLEKRENKHYTCGVCDALAAGYGVSARSMLSRDAVYLSLLTYAQMADALSTGSAAAMQPEKKCRPWSSAGPTAREFAYAAAASVAAYCGLLIDRLHDEPSLTVSVQYALCRKRMMAANSRLKDFGLDLPMETLVAKQHSNEADRSRSPSNVTEGIYSALFSQSAVVAGVPANAPGLCEVGRNVGRIAYLVDGYVDAESDRKRGSFNACSAMASALGLSGADRIREEVESRAEESLRAISRAVDEIRLRSHGAQIRHSLTEGLRARVGALMDLGARAKPKQPYPLSIAPVAIFIVKGLVSPSADDYCCSSDCLTCGITEEDCCGAALPPGSNMPTGVLASAGLGGVGAIVGAGVGILASGIGQASAPAGSTPGATADASTAQVSAPPPGFMQQWGPPPPGLAPPESPNSRHYWIDWRDDWRDASEEQTRINRGITPGQEVTEILTDRPPWMRDYDYTSGKSDMEDFYRKYGTARYLSDDQVNSLPPDKRAEYDRWIERYRSWQRRHPAISEFVSTAGSRG